MFEELDPRTRLDRVNCPRGGDRSSSKGESGRARRRLSLGVAAPRSPSRSLATSVAGPSECDDLFVFGALGNVADSHVAKHERQRVARMLKHQLHPPLAVRALGVIHILNPTGPACQFVAGV